MRARRAAGVLAACGLLAACTIGSAAPAPSSPDPAAAAATPATPAAPSVPPPRALAVIGAEDPALPYAYLHARQAQRELIVVEPGTVLPDEPLDIEVIRSTGQGDPLTGLVVETGTPVRALLVGDPARWATRVARESAGIVVAAEPQRLAIGLAEDDLAVVPLPEDLRAAGPVHDLVASTTLSVTYDGPPDRRWQLDVVTSSPELPGGGGHLLLPGRRLVALYGHVGHASLGVLGEQGPEAAAARAVDVAAPFAADGLAVVPAFDLITTLASGSPTSDGDYSQPTSIEQIRPWLDAIRAVGGYLVLDLQPGRTDFLTQARQYEELLLEPDVGLALDPEWRLKPNQVHLRQIGSVTAAEVNGVADWLAALVREHNLPQKLFLVHQFKLTMITERDTLDTSHPELAHMIQMDGQGSIGSKDETYRAITRGFADRILWGWKSFYDEDRPTPSPEHVLSRDPVPLFVSYQ